MRSTNLDEQTIHAVILALRTAAGEVEHTVDLLEGKLSADVLSAHKRVVGKVINAIYSGLADPLLEGFPEIKKALYEQRD